MIKQIKEHTNFMSHGASGTATLLIPNQVHRAKKLEKVQFPRAETTFAKTGGGAAMMAHRLEVKQ